MNKENYTGDVKKPLVVKKPLNSQSKTKTPHVKVKPPIIKPKAKAVTLVKQKKLGIVPTTAAIDKQVNSLNQQITSIATAENNLAIYNEIIKVTQDYLEKRKNAKSSKAKEKPSI